MSSARPRRWRWVLLGLLVLALYGLSGLRPSIETQTGDVALEPTGPVRATFVGVSTVMFDDGQSAILVDGFFSRPGLLKTALGRVGPDETAVRNALQRLGVLDGPIKLLAVVTAHSHYDHAMDAPLVVKLTGAMLVGSASTRMIGLGQGLLEDQIEVPDLNETLRLGPFQLRMIPSIHSPTPWNDGHDGGVVETPLVPPVHAARYKEGGSFSLHFEHHQDSAVTRWLVQGSAGYVAGRLDRLQADTVFLGVGTLGRKATRYKESYWLETVTAVGARHVVPIHWDDFTIGLDQALRPLPYWLDNVHSTYRYTRGKAEQDGITVLWLQGWQTFRLPTGAKQAAPPQAVPAPLKPLPKIAP